MPSSAHTDDHLGKHHRLLKKKSCFFCLLSQQIDEQSLKGEKLRTADGVPSCVLADSISI
jgi:hypothetical protein